MLTVQANLIISFIDSDDENFQFGENWNFSIEGFTFKRLNEKEVEVEFQFPAELEKMDDEMGKYQEMPSQYLEEFQPFEDKLEKLLDILSLHIGACLKIGKRSYQFSSSIGISHRLNNTSILNVDDLDGILPRYKNLLGASSNDTQAVRLFRQSLGMEEKEDRIQKLWESLLRIHGGGTEKMLKKEDLKILSQCIEKITHLSKKQKEKLVSMIRDVEAKGQREVVAENMDIMDEKGTFTKEEKMAILGRWRHTRGASAHGEKFSKRDEVVEDDLWDIRNTVEGFLYNSVKPKMLAYLVFKADAMKPEMIENWGKRISIGKDGVAALPIRYDDIKFYIRSFKVHMKPNHPLYLVDFKGCSEIGENGITKVDFKPLDSSFKEVIKKVLKKF